MFKKLRETLTGHKEEQEVKSKEQTEVENTQTTPKSAAVSTAKADPIATSTQSDAPVKKAAKAVAERKPRTFSDPSLHPI